MEKGEEPLKKWTFIMVCKKKIILLSLFLLLLLPYTVIGETTNVTIEAAGKVTVTDVKVDPAILMTGDVGMVTFTVENTGTSNVVITDAELISREITILNSDIYKVSRTVGAGTKTQFAFTILANQPENIYYPAFYINYRDAGSLRYNVPIRVEEPQLEVSISGIPETYTKGVMSRIYLTLGNAKSVNITGILVNPSGEGIQINRTSAFIGVIGPHTDKSIGFEITPSSSTNLNFDINYTCGMNSHHTSYSLPILIGTDKKAADPIINNVEYSSSSSGIAISGDVSNAGIEDANGVVVSLESEAGDDGNPNQKYVVGTITSGDYSSFDITVPRNLREIPLVIDFKDSSGNQLSKKVTLHPQLGNLGNSTGSSGPEAGGMPPGEFSGSGGGGTPTGSYSSRSASSGSSGGGQGFNRGSRGGINPMNPLSGMGKGLNGIPVMEILYGLGILVILVIVWRLWKRRSKGRITKISIK